MAIRNREQAIAWVVHEAKTETARKISEVNWQLLGLDLVPEGLDYLQLECAYFCGPMAIQYWMQDACAHVGVERGALDQERGDVLMKVVARVIQLRRRRDSLLALRINHAPYTNRANRLARRVLQLVKVRECERLAA